jgi:hypothetical protein
MSILSEAGADALIGNWPGYVLTFHGVGPDGTPVEAEPVVLHSDSYEAEIEIGLTGGVERSTTALVLVGLSVDDHRKLAARTDRGAFVLAVARLHQFWRDAIRSVGG